MVCRYLDELRTIANLPLMSESEKATFFFNATNYDHTQIVLVTRDKNREVIGFLLIGTRPNCHPDADYYIEEAYVQPEYRKQGYMTKAVKSFVEQHKGTYCMFILNGNSYARQFWSKLFAGIGYTPCVLRDVGATDETCKQYGFRPLS